MADSVSEDDAADYRQQAGEEAWQAFLERRARMGGPEAPEPCEKCDGAGSFWQKEKGGRLSGSRTLCSRCLGTRVQS